MYQEYKVLRKSPAVFTVFAWIALALGAISAVIIISGISLSESPRWTGIVTLVVGAVYFLIFTVISQGIRLLLDMNDRIK